MQCANGHCCDRHFHNPNLRISELPLIPLHRRTLLDNEDFPNSRRAWACGFSPRSHLAGPWRTTSTRDALPAACTALAQRAARVRRSHTTRCSERFSTISAERYGPGATWGPRPRPRAHARTDRSRARQVYGALLCPYAARLYKASTSHYTNTEMAKLCLPHTPWLGLCSS